MTVDHREINAFRLATPELILQLSLRVRSRREDDEPRRVAVDAVHDEGPPLAARSQMQHQFVLHRGRVLFPLERHRQQAWRLVDDDQRIVLIDNAKLAGRAARAASSFARCRDGRPRNARDRRPQADARHRPASPRRR